MADYLIGIDAGHGGRDPGAVGPAGTTEKEDTRVIAGKTIYYLQRAGLSTYSTRDDDRTVSLWERSNGLNKAGVDFSVSVHVNASESPDPGYISVWVQGLGGRAEILAKCISKQLKGAVPWPNIGIRVANFHMNRETVAPSCLVECGFISNPEEEAALADMAVRDTIARAIARGCTDYIMLVQKMDS